MKSFSSMVTTISCVHLRKYTANNIIIAQSMSPSAPADVPCQLACIPRLVQCTNQAIL